MFIKQSLNIFINNKLNYLSAIAFMRSVYVSIATIKAVS